MHLLFLCLAMLALNVCAWGQERLMMYPSFGAVHFEYEKDTVAFQVTPKQVSQILFDQPEALREFKTARTHSTLSGICGFVGMGLILVPTATAALGGDAEWVMAAGGAALVIGSIPLSRSYRRKAQHAIDLFNRKHSAFLLRPYLQFRGTGASLILRF
jgi:hypothetical protein